jgi:hypothetical protein
MKIIRQPASGEGMKILNNELESLVTSNVRDNYPGNWKSEHITSSLFSSLKKLFHGRSIHTPGGSLKTFWRLKILSEDTEATCSDLAIIFQIAYHDGQTSRGVVFYDVAEKDPGKNTFSKLSRNKFRKMLAFAPHSQLLLYDYDTITGMAFPSTVESIIGSHPLNWNNWIPFTHAVSVPAGVALPLDIKNTGLYKISLPLSYQLCYRNFYGLDLDYTAPALETAAGIRTGRGLPRILVMISVTHGGSLPLNAFNFDNNKYIEFE